MKASFEAPRSNTNTQQSNAYYNITNAIWVQDTILPQLETLITEYPDRELKLVDDKLSARTLQIKILMGLKYLECEFDDQQVVNNVARIRKAVKMLSPVRGNPELRVLTAEQYSKQRAQTVAQTNKRTKTGKDPHAKFKKPEAATLNIFPLAHFQSSLDAFLKTKEHNGKNYIKFESVEVSDVELDALRKLEPVGLQLSYNSAIHNLVLVWD